VAVVTATAMAGSALAAELTLGIASEPSAMDPHYHNLGPNNATRHHIFDSLIIQDAKQQLTPGLAVSWKPLDDTTWEFKLRQGVKFHDGSDFTADDVLFTFDRVAAVPNSPSSFTVYTKNVVAMETPDPHTIIFKTAKPHPLLPVEISTLAVMSRKASAAAAKPGADPKLGVTTEQMNAGEGTIGTGPYTFVEFVKGDRLVLARNDGYWGDKEPWDKVIFKPITNAAARVAALLAGDVDAIEKPPTQDLPRLEADPNIEVSSGLSNRVIYLHFDHEQEPTPGIGGTDGKNPFKDVRVRQAVSKAIDRPAIVEKVMGGVAVAAAQLLPPGMFGNNSDLEVEAFDPAGAKALLAEAGYPNGFELVLGSPNDRYINDAKIAQAVAQMLTRVGIKTTVDAMTKSVFFSRRNKYEFSLYMAGWGSGTGEMSSPLRALVATRNKDKGFGGTNRGRYSNPDLDALIEKALATVDDTQREAVLREASALVMKDYGILPLHYEVTSWAVRKGLTYEPRTDQYTLAKSVRSAN
jgi:peptide/nickel transport system substrate-binding protein